MSPRNLKGIAKGLDICGFGIIEYSSRSESGHMIALRDQECYVPGLPNYLSIIYPNLIFTSEGYKVAFISHCHGEHDIYAELNFKEYKPG